MDVIGLCSHIVHQYDNSIPVSEIVWLWQLTKFGFEAVAKESLLVPD